MQFSGKINQIIGWRPFGKSRICHYFSSLWAPSDVSKCEIRDQGVCEDYISKVPSKLDQLICNGIAKVKLAMLVSLSWGEFVKNSVERTMFLAVDQLLQNLLR